MVPRGKAYSYYTRDLNFMLVYHKYTNSNSDGTLAIKVCENRMKRCSGKVHNINQHKTAGGGKEYHDFKLRQGIMSRFVNVAAHNKYHLKTLQILETDVVD